MFDSILKVYPFFAWIGSLVILTGIVIAAPAFRGKSGERYALRNHFISELGEYGVSRFALFFNFGLFLGGLCYLPVMIGLGLTLRSVWAYLGMGAGIIAGLAGSLVGIFPMNRLKPHRISAMTFFRSGLVMILMFTVAIFTQPAENRTIPLFVNVFGFFSILAYSIFMSIVRTKMDCNHNQNYILDPTVMPERPHFWRTAFWEWVILFSTLLWFLIIAAIAW